MRFISFFLALLLGLPALASSQASAKLYTRVQGDEVQAAVVIDIDLGWHIYHGPTMADLGHPDAVGAPTTFSFESEGIQWSQVVYPEPYEEDQSDISPGAFILAHEFQPIFYAVGAFEPGTTPSAEGISVFIKGLACETSCIPYQETVATEGAGRDKFWKDYPADLHVPKQVEPVPAKDEISGGKADVTLYTRVINGIVEAALKIDIEPGFHLFHTEKGNDMGIGRVTQLELKGAGVTWSQVVWPEPEVIDQSDAIPGASMLGHHGSIFVYAQGSLSAGASGEGLWGEISGQTCDDSQCLTYGETFVSVGEGDAAIWEGFPRGAASDSGKQPEEKSLFAFLAEAVLWGLITLLMPCTYPMIPITISFFTKQAEKRGGNVLPLSLAYGAGIVMVFIIIGVAVGSVIVPFAQHPVTNIIIGGMFLFFAMSLFGFVNLQPPRFLLNVAGQASMKGGYVGVFLMGTTLVVTSFTCTAPFVGTLLARGASGSDGNLGRVVMGMTAFGLTMAIPFVLLSLVPKKIQALPKSGEWMNTLKISFGFIEVAAAMKFLSTSDLGWGWNVISREFFLVSWIVIFTLMGLFLLGLFKVHGNSGRVGPGRVLTGVLSLALAAYCGWGTAGKEMNYIMVAIVPPYSGGLLFPEWHEEQGSWTRVLDDYELAKATATEEGKLVLLNFTGFT